MPDPPPRPPERLLSIDALRGFDMFWIIGGDRLFHALADWLAPGTRGAAVVHEQLEHVDWKGFRFYDLIFPLFLFLVGVVLPFSLGKVDPDDRLAAYRRIARRTLLLFGLGLLCNNVLQFRWQELRVAGVLQRIALCYGMAAVLVRNLDWRGRLTAIVVILAAYSILLANVAPPGGTAGDLSPSGNLAGWIDRHYLPGQIKKEYYGFGDNEGILSTIPALATALLGSLAGDWLRSTRRPWTKAAGLLGSGLACLAIGFAWSVRFPIIKILWTGPYVLVAGGFSLALLSLFYAVIDVLRWRRWSFFFVVIGANAITIYVVPRFVDFEKIARFFLGGVYRLADLHVSTACMAVLAAAGVLGAKWLFLHYLYRKRIFLRV